MENPYESPVATADDYPLPVEKEYGGIGRLAYVGGSIGIGILQNILQVVAAQAEQALALILIFIASIAGTLVLAAYRLKNIGSSPWWCLGLLVPLLNILIGLRCLLCPEGYADTKKLDTAGKIGAGIILGLFVLLIVFVIVAGIASS